MKRISLLGLTLVVISALGAMTSASAFAEVEIRPNGTKAMPINVVASDNEPSILETTNGTKISCAKATAKGEVLTANSGLALADYKECKSSGVNCNSPGDEKGVILTLGTLQMVDVLPTGTLDLGVWAESKEELPGTGDLHFVCGGIVSVVILGSVIGVAQNSKGELLTSPAKGKEFKGVSKQTKGEQEIKECDFPVAFCEKEKVKNKFLGLIDFGAGHELFGRLLVVNVTFEKEVELIF